MIKQHVEELNSMILSGKTMDAFEKFYADNVSMKENGHPATVGKDANRDREIEFFGNVTEFRGAEVLSTVVDEEQGVAMCQWNWDYTHKEWGVMKYTCVSVQKWENGQIVSEQFHYSPN